MGESCITHGKILERERAFFYFLFFYLMMRENKNEEKMQMVQYGQRSTLSCVGLRLLHVLLCGCAIGFDLSKSKW